MAKYFMKIFEAKARPPKYIMPVILRRLYKLNDILYFHHYRPSLLRRARRFIRQSAEMTYAF